MSSHGSRGYLTYSQLPEDHQMLREMCRKFADEQLAPEAGRIDKGKIRNKSLAFALLSRLSLGACLQRARFLNVRSRRWANLD